MHKLLLTAAVVASLSVPFLVQLGEPAKPKEYPPFPKPADVPAVPSAAERKALESTEAIPDGCLGKPFAHVAYLVDCTLNERGYAKPEKRTARYFL